MKSATTINQSARGTFLFIGNPGSGKTSTALRFPNVYVFDCDDNVLSAVKYTGLTNFCYSTPYLDDNDKPIAPANRYARLSQELNLAALDPTIDTIVIDSLTSLVDILCSQAKKLGGIADDAQMRIQDWGTFGGLIRNLVTSLKSSGKTIIFIGHTELEQDESTKRWLSFISFPGKARTTLPGLFSEVLLFTTTITGFGANAKTLRIVRTEPENSNDMRCLKDTYKLPAEIPLDDFIKNIIPKLTPSCPQPTAPSLSASTSTPPTTLTPSPTPSSKNYPPSASTSLPSTSATM